MKVSKKWLNQYVDIHDISAQDLANRLTLAGLEVESINYLAQGTNLVVGYVEVCDKHPNADHLSVTKVNVGAQTLQIICGAPNVAVGQKVIVALSGAVLPDITIQKALIKGIESNGMICSLLELGVDAKYLSESQKNGIEVLPEEAKIGDPALPVLGLDDVILDIKQTPNRSDFNALWSVAYEVGALFNRPVKLPMPSTYKELSSSIKIESKTDACPLILGKKIGSLIVSPSPLWLRQALNAVGIKSINNVVDISNYVMIETGQPLHFYDGSKLSKAEIIVVDQCVGQVKTLDESLIELNLEDIVITSNLVNIGLAGIMGGDDSKIDESTTSIIIEAAIFNPARIRHTSRRVNLITEASLRFQKGLNPLGAKQAMDRATQLLIELADASQVEATLTYGEADESLKQVSVTHQHIEDLLGTKVNLDTILDIFNRLGFNPKQKGNEIICTIPSYRLDISVSEDLIEEVGRFIGYTDLVGTLPLMASTMGGYDDRQKLCQRIKSLLVGEGLHEIVSYTLVSQEKTLVGFDPLENPLRLLSPISDEREYIRNNLLNSVLDVVAYNQAHKILDFSLFEISTLSHIDRCQERLALVLSGSKISSRWQKQCHKYDFYSIKGLIENILTLNGYALSRFQYKPLSDHPFFHPGQSAILTFDKQVIGYLGVLHPMLAQKLGVSDVVMAELNLEPLVAAKPSKIKYNPIIKVPVVSRDLALIVDESLSSNQLISVLMNAGKPILKNIEVFDVYTGDHVESGKKSIALSLYFQASDHTLSEEEISTVLKKVIDASIQQCQAILRS